MVIKIESKAVNKVMLKESIFYFRALPEGRLSITIFFAKGFLFQSLRQILRFFFLHKQNEKGKAVFHTAC
jgi:hypothetical protein